MITSLRILPALAVLAMLGTSAFAQSVSVGFDIGEGFTTGPVNGSAAAAGAFDDVTISSGGFDVTFSGGQQQQSFDGPSYQAGGTGFLFVNTGGGAATFTGTSGNTITGGLNNGDQTGSITFSGLGASTVSFYAADRANGAESLFDVVGTDGTILQDDVSIDSGSVSDNFFSLDASALGGNIGSITFDLPGPAANAPYVLGIDTFSATAATVASVPEPSSIVALMSVMAIAGLRRRR